MEEFGQFVDKSQTNKNEEHLYLKNDIRDCFELCFLTTTILLVIALFSLPIIFYHIKIGEQTIPQSVTTDAPRNACLSSGPLSNSTNCSSYSWGRVSTGVNCTAVPYTGSVCRGHLSTWQQCAIGQGDSVPVNDTGKLMEAERNATTLTNLLSTAASRDCQTAAAPFLCHYQFPLCDCAAGDVLLPSRETCLHVSMDACRTEWLQVQRFGLGHLLPDCSQLPQAAENGSDNVDAQAEGSGSNSTSATELPPVICRENFILMNGTCQPICHLWAQTSPPWSVILRSLSIISLSVGLICGLVVIGLGLLRYEKMLTFPSISLIYFNIGYCIIATVGLIGEAAKQSAYCSSISLLVTINNPTPFCTLAGAVIHYFLINMSLWWLVHIYFMFHKIMWPLHGVMIEEKQRWIHLTIFIVVSVIPLPAVLVVISPDYQYNIFQFPPLFCIPNNSFYSLTMVLDIISAEGITLLIIVLGIVYKYQGLFRNKKEGQCLVSSAEKRLLIVFSYNTLCIVISMVFSSLASSNVAQQFVQALTTHFTCEALGYTPGKCDRSLFEQYGISWVFILILVLLGLIPIVSLVFVLDTHEVRKQLKKCYSGTGCRTS